MSRTKKLTDSEKLMLDIIECSSVQTGNYQRAIKAAKKFPTFRHMVPSKDEQERTIKRWKT